MLERTSQHPSDDAIEAYCLNRFPSRDLEHFETHLLNCGACRSRVDSTYELVLCMKIALADSVASPETPAFELRYG
jgi:hypothetical protein